MAADEQTVNGHTLPKNSNFDIGNSKDLEKLVNALEVVCGVVKSTAATVSSASIGALGTSAGTYGFASDAERISVEGKIDAIAAALTSIGLMTAA